MKDERIFLQMQPGGLQWYIEKGRKWHHFWRWKGKYSQRQRVSVVITRGAMIKTATAIGILRLRKNFRYEQSSIDCSIHAGKKWVMCGCITPFAYRSRLISNLPPTGLECHLMKLFIIHTLLNYWTMNVTNTHWHNYIGTAYIFCEWYTPTTGTSWQRSKKPQIPPLLSVAV